MSSDLDSLFTVFDGSSPDDVSHARRLWSSVWLLPPQESRQVSAAEVRQRLPVCRPQRVGAARTEPQPLNVKELQQRQEERKRFLAMADQRKEILALLKRQRERRIQKELLSQNFRYKTQGSGGEAEKADSSAEDVELVRTLD
ncbi:cilia- and flagella-associated protein HOATZ [Neosynchiropus ocellatus]